LGAVFDMHQRIARTPHSALPTEMGPFTFEPIGVVHSPFSEKVSAPRQAATATGVEGTITLFPGRSLEHALEDLETWERIWVLFVFDRADGWRPKVRPPRSVKRRGVLATRSPHRPNPIGLSAVRLVGVEGLTLRVRDLDILDGTPVLDLKPYVAYADAFPDAGSGWLGQVADPVPPTPVQWHDEARAQADWLEERGVALSGVVERALALGAAPNAYRRIRRVAETGGELELAVKEWRVRFRAAPGAIVVLSIRTGYRPRDLALGDSPPIALARAFTTAFGVHER
jgi:tRNA-Thr(GGU) m(6)t(6)A37 methyltransferase TsaA